MLETFMLAGWFLAGVVFARLWQKYMEEDIDLLKAEALHICNRLDKVLTELRQLNAKPQE